MNTDSLNSKHSVLICLFASDFSVTAPAGPFASDGRYSWVDDSQSAPFLSCPYPAFLLQMTVSSLSMKLPEQKSEQLRLAHVAG
jgi:hypothetical protein